ncbi:MAG: inositol monophosphatase family protein, partial [Pseudomonadota bacterium]
MPVADTHPLSRDHKVLLEAMGEAGELARSLFDRGVETWEKEDKTPVTEADLAVDTLLRERLAAACPEYGWLSEETQENPARRSFKRVWIVDPIDGTKGFVRGTDQWCISAALVEDGLPLLGIIVNPVRGELFQAVR